MKSKNSGRPSINCFDVVGPIPSTEDSSDSVGV
jgi:hypothetical protein